MKGQFARLTIFMCVCVIIIAGITAVTYAVWTTSDGGSTPATTQTGEWEDPSFRYLVLEIVDNNGAKTELRYAQTAADGSEISAFDAGDIDVSAITSVTVKGYEGILTTLKIPPSVKIAAAGQTVELPVTAIAMGTVEQYDGLRLIKELEIPSSVNEIAAYSFAFCDSLEKVVFMSGGGELTLGEKCFYRCVRLQRSAVDFGGRSVSEGADCFA